MATFRVKIKGTSPLITNDGFKGIDPDSPLVAEAKDIKSRRGTNRTAADDKRLRQLDCQISIWQTETGEIGIPWRAFYACLDGGARAFKEGKDCRTGVFVKSSAFEWDKSLGADIETLSQNIQFTVPAVISRQRVNVTRAKFDRWACTFELDCDAEVVDKAKLERWVEMAGLRAGLGDWRPGSPKGGFFGRFELTELEEIGA